MKYLTLETFSDFVCIGADCPYTCCAGGWNIYIDEETAKYYRSVYGEMGEKLRNSIQEKDGKTSFIMNEEGRCPFLNERGLCEIYINLGEEHLSNTCTYYPRYAYYSGDICFAGVSISCPEVSRYYLTRKEQFLIDYAEDDIPYDGEKDTDWRLFNNATRAFTTLVSIAQNRDYNIRERYVLVMAFVYSFQNCISIEHDPGEIIGLFGNPEGYDQLLGQTSIKDKDYAAKLKFCTESINYFRMVDELDTIFPEMSAVIKYFSDTDNATFNLVKFEKSFDWIDDDKNQIWLENVLVYLIYRYFMQGFNNREFYSKTLTGVILVFNVAISIISLYGLSCGENADLEYIIPLISHISRLVEHNHSFTGKALDRFRNVKMDEISFLVEFIS